MGVNVVSMASNMDHTYFVLGDAPVEEEPEPEPVPISPKVSKKKK
jgi:hypothetical protein